MKRFLVFLIIVLCISSCREEKVSNNNLTSDTIKSSQNDTSFTNIKLTFVTKYNLGTEDFLEENKDSQSYLPLDFIYSNQKLLFIPGRRGFEIKNGNIEYLNDQNFNLIVYDLEKKNNIDNNSINTIIANNTGKDSYLEKLCINGDTGLVYFNNISLIFSIDSNSVKYISSYKPPKGSNFILIENNGKAKYTTLQEIVSINSNGNIVEKNEINAPKGNDEYYQYKNIIYTTMGEFFNVNDIINKRTIRTIKTTLSQEETINKYALLGVSDQFSIWVRNAISSENSVEKINELLFFDLNTGILSRKVIIDPTVLDCNKIDQTYYPEMGFAWDPPELRQYLRICYGAGKYYLMFQSKKIIYIYSFSV